MEHMEQSRVLVVDDEPQITRVLRTVLSSQGYDVHTASNGFSGLRAAEECLWAQPLPARARLSVAESESHRWTQRQTGRVRTFRKYWCHTSTLGPAPLDFWAEVQDSFHQFSDAGRVYQSVDPSSSERDSEPSAGICHYQTSEQRCGAGYQDRVNLFSDRA